MYMALTTNHAINASNLFQSSSTNRPIKQFQTHRQLMYPPFYASEAPSTSQDSEYLASTDEYVQSIAFQTNLDPQSLSDSETEFHGNLEAYGTLFDNALRFFELSFGSTDGVFTQVPPMYEAASNQAHIRSSVKALGLERLGLHSQSRSLLAQAQSEYGRTLMKVREALGDPIQSREDEILVTISILCQFEFIRSATENISFSHTHGDAIPLVLMHRGHEQLQHARSKTIFLCLQSRLLMYCIDRSYAIEEVLGELAEVPETPDNASMQLLRTAREVNRLQTRIGVLMRASARDRNALQNAARSLLSFGREINNRLDQWGMSTEESWHYTLSDADDVLYQEEHYAEQVHVYPNIWIARMWNAWRVIRINLQIAIDGLLNWIQAILGKDLVEERQRSHHESQTMVDQICNTVHYHLGNKSPQNTDPIAKFPVDGPYDTYESHALEWGWFHLLVPLRTCTRAPGLLAHQEQWVHRSLVRISRLACQANNRPAPTAPPVLMTEQLPSTAFVFPIVAFGGDTEPNPGFFGADPELLPSRGPPYAPLPTQLPSVVLPSQPADDIEALSLRDRLLRSPSVSSGRAASPVAKPSSTPQPQQHQQQQQQQLDLPFFNTTEPGQIKDPATQKKIRRDVMLHHMRTQDPKQREERQRKARAGSAARAASRKGRDTSANRRKEDDAGETSGGGGKRKESARKSGKGKERA